jgi:hypothetical protein
VQSDAIVWYDWATLTNKGHVPGESELLPLPYGPLFLYIIAFLLKLWNDPRVIIIFSLLSEFILFVVWLSLKNKPVARDDLALQRASILYAFSPLSILTTVVGGNNDVLAGMWVSIFVALAFLNKPALSGAAAGLSVVTSKALTIIAGVPVFLASGNKMVWLSSAVLPVMIVYGIWTVFLSAVGIQGHAYDYTSGNLPFWLGLFGVDVITSPVERWIVNVVGAFLVLGVASLPFFAYRTFASKDIVPIIAAMTTMFVMVSAKSFPHYMLIALFPIMIIIAEMKIVPGMIVYFLFGVAASVESSIWFRMFHNESSISIYETRVSNWFVFLAFGIVETILIALCGIILWFCIRNYVKALFVGWPWRDTLRANL